MNKFLFVFLLTIISCSALAQSDPRPTRSRFYNNKLSAFAIKEGDILVYHVSKNGDEYDYIVTVNKFGDEINFDFKIPTKNSSGSSSITSTTVNSGTKYVTDFTVNGKPTLWLSKSNYRDLFSDKETKMDAGNGMETFVRNNTTTMKINYKGKEKIVTLYNIENQSDANKKKLGVLTEINNPLIVMIDAGYTITLKEVR